MPAACRILLVDDDPLVRSGLRLLLTSDPGMDVVGEVADGDEAVEAVQRHAPDVGLMDLRIARMDGVAATRAVRELPLAQHVIVLTVWHFDQPVLRSHAAGAEAVAEGLSNAEAAERLYVSAATVKAHLATIQTKLGVRNRVQVAVQAERAGLLR